MHDLAFNDAGTNAAMSELEQNDCEYAYNSCLCSIINIMEWLMSRGVKVGTCVLTGAADSKIVATRLDRSKLSC